jgi:hypothetical protein
MKLAFIRYGNFNSLENLVVVDFRTIPPYHPENSDDLMSRIKRAVTKWMENTEEGEALWEETCGDYNIGDLLMERDNESLSSFLLEERIAGYEILFDLGQVDSFPYDTLLGDPSF